MYQSFPGKLILFGEYSIISGSKALVMPLPNFWGRLCMPGTEVQSEKLIFSKSEARKSNQEFRGFFEYLVRLQKEAGHIRKQDLGGLNIDLESLEADLESGLYFQSSIPVQYGAGSSAALVASVFDAYSREDFYKSSDAAELIHLRQILGKLESYFHGSSSGIDPLCSFTGKALYIQKDQILPVRIPATGKDSKLFLLDSGVQAETDSLVSAFKARMEGEHDFARKVNAELSVLVEHGIDKIIRENEGEENKKQNELREIFREVSEWQLKHFAAMIPQSVIPVWEQGLQSGDYSLKLCGSGGGGFFLGYAGQWTKISGLLNEFEMKIITLDL